MGDCFEKMSCMKDQLAAAAYSALSCGIENVDASEMGEVVDMIKDIAEYEGNPPEIEKELMKYQHMINTGCDYFSLSDCTMDTAREFINTLMEHAITNGIPLAEMGVERTDDIGRYLYYCLKAKKCCVCGKPGEIHHVDTIGMGNDRRKVDDSEYRKMCLCREHHTMWHNLGDERFQKMYKVYGIVIKDQLPPGDNISHKSP